MIFFSLVPFHEVRHEIEPNVPRHYHEMTEGDEYGIPNIDWETYTAASKIGRCVAVTVRDNNNLIGYAVYSICHNLRYKHIIEATSDGIFLEKEYRGRLSQEFTKKADEYLKDLGVHETNYILSDDRVGRLLGRNGYQSKYKVWNINYGQ